MMNNYSEPVFKCTSKVLLVSLLCFFPGLADRTASPSALLSLVRKNYGPETQLKARFTQTIYWSVREKEERRHGRIWLAPGDRFRVEIDREVFASDGETFRHWSPGANQLVVRRLADVDRSSLPSNIFASQIASCPLRETVRKKGVVRLEWKRDSGQAQTMYKEMAVSAEEATGRIRTCILTDNNGNVFTYVFSATVFGQTPPRERFEINAPKSARVVDMRQ